MTDYEWEVEQRKKQKDMFLIYRNQPNEGNTTQINNLRVQQSKPEVGFRERCIFLTINQIVLKLIFQMCLRQFLFDSNDLMQFDFHHSLFS